MEMVGETKNSGMKKTKHPISYLAPFHGLSKSN